MEYTKRMRYAAEKYNEMNTAQLWNELILCDIKINKYLFEKSKCASPPAKNNNKEKNFFRNMEESIVLFALLRKMPGNELYKIYEYMNLQKVASTDKTEKANLEQTLKFFEKEFF
ncbi:MAG: hypothetical protein V1660_01015 [archaeon]